MSTYGFANPGYVALLTAAPLQPLITAPADGSFLYVDIFDPRATGGPWVQDTYTGTNAYARDGRGAFVQAAFQTNTPMVFRVLAATMHLDALSGFGCNGPLGFRITRASDGQVMYDEAINQAGGNSATGSNRTVTLPYAEYYVAVSNRGTGGNEIAAVDGIGIRNR